MRVIAGTLKGRRLKSPSWEGLRPTSDKLRETLFNVLAPRIAGARVLDAYAGTGAVGIEAVSRGAAWATFVEHDRRAQALIAENIELCGIKNVCAIIRAKVASALATMAEDSTHEPFDIVWCDPPYGQSGRDGIDTIDIVLSASGRVLRRGGVVVLEHARRQRAPAVAGTLSRSRDLMSGDSVLTFYEAGRQPPFSF